ncbi:hypothetical protein MT340_012350 [Staphylococcus sp. NRL 16/872]|uniref:hypothetical protein n=1 Tax=Staphylococcus sp. NRL 16/872 TaxID=2930131 RepID=UPI001FB46287|nr:MULTISPECIES: hypothetical protein [unclassified Staphylococcus]MCJ1657268.1 hypothetical protein [Staphylococcus sp. NRL 21/187]MCJ1662989.1 hypothetical protein [Staphylococcus sp. NRL 18/288]MCJ1669113.1 hypothetical protein [Staphylococcus sp. NRL 19/737]WEN69351.1 hypothetical protein MT340_012350 [Staphylococcus sp. NRL 16/872]
MDNKKLNEEPVWCKTFNYISNLFIVLGTISLILIPFFDVMENIAPVLFMVGYLLNIIPNFYKKNYFIVYVDIFVFVLIIIIKLVT